MAYIDWAESMSVGNPAIDHDHKIIVRLINKLHEHVSTEREREVVGQALNILIEYTLFHFAREEQVMKACKYPGFPHHKLQHEDLTRQVADIAHRFSEKNEPIDQDELMAFLKSWLINHILKDDMGFRLYAEGSPEVVRLTRKLLDDEYAAKISRMHG